MPTDITALKKYHAMVRIINGKKVVDAKDILSLSWQEYRELITMHNLPQVDHVNVEGPTPNSVSYWLMKDLPMKQTLCFWLACCVLLIYASNNNSHKKLPAAIGFMSWIPIEYGYHRFIGHMPVVSDTTKRANFYLHGKHHFAPKDLDHVLLPPVLILMIAALFYQFVLSNITQNPEIALMFTILHYLLYDTMHYALHKFSLNDVLQIPLVGKMLIESWKNHARHHAEPEGHFSVTTVNVLDRFNGVMAG